MCKMCKTQRIRAQNIQRTLQVGGKKKETSKSKRKMGQVIQGKTETAIKHKKRRSTSLAMQIKTTKYFGCRTGKSEKVWQYRV